MSQLNLHEKFEYSISNFRACLPSFQRGGGEGSYRRGGGAEEKVVFIGELDGEGSFQQGGGEGSFQRGGEGSFQQGGGEPAITATYMKLREINAAMRPRSLNTLQPFKYVLCCNKST